ncbi:hypothetical protein ACKKBG_A15670 [Auxenochlorella protothecoides x Auxenochlorella symbiontica]
MRPILQILLVVAGLVLFTLANLTNQRIWPNRLVSVSLESGILSSSQVVESASCSIYVLDPARDLGMPACDYSDTAIWPHALKKTGLGGSTVPLQHWEYQYSTHLWLEEAITNSGARTDRLSRADLIFVNMHCYEIWRAGKWWQTHKEGVKNGVDPELYRVQAMEYLRSWPQWRQSNGSRFVVAPFNPALPKKTLDAQRPCSSSPFVITSEHSMMCEQKLEAHARQGLIVPYVTDTHQEGFDPLAATRDTLLFYRGGCSPSSSSAPSGPRYSSGKLLRRAVVDAVQASNATDVDVRCGCDICPGALSHSQVLARMRSSRYCLMLPGDKASSRRGTEAALSGCIPVIVGPPWHTLVLADDIDHAASSVFISVRHVTWVVANASLARFDNRPGVLTDWYLDTELRPGEMLHVDTLAEVLGVLRGMPPEVLAAKQAALAREAYKQYWLPAPGEDKSQLGEIVVKRLCEHAQALKNRGIIPPHPTPLQRRKLLAE